MGEYHVVERVVGEYLVMVGKVAWCSSHAWWGGQWANLVIVEVAGGSSDP